MKRKRKRRYIRSSYGKGELQVVLKDVKTRNEILLEMANAFNIQCVLTGRQTIADKKGR